MVLNLFLLQAQTAPQGSLLTSALPILLIFGIFYFLLFLPMQRQRKSQQKMLSGLQNGNVVVNFGAAADPHIAGEVLVFVAQDSGGRVEWRCEGDGTTLKTQYRPVGCQ